MEARFVDGVAQIDPAAWDALTGGESPFCDHAFLAACEAASATPEHGILARHLTLWDGDALLAAVPLYVKGDGRAEFIYDYGWYHLAWQSGIDYYPKAVSMAPLTPVPGPHFLLRDDVDRGEAIAALVELIEHWAGRSGLTGVHFLFATDDEADRLEQLGYLRRLTFQLALTNRFDSFDDYLARFRSKDRIKIKRDLRLVRDQGLEIELVEGDAIGADEIEAMYGYYSNTCDQHGTGSNYVQRGTWDRLGRDWREPLLMLFARDASGRRVAGSLLVQRDGVLYGRYWGADGQWNGLYFALAFYEPTRLMIERGWSRFLVGFGNARYKRDRGFDPAPTHSLHRFFDPRLSALVERVVRAERAEAQQVIEILRGDSKLREQV